MPEKPDRLEQLESKTDKVLAAIGGLSDRLGVVERHAGRLPSIEERLESLAVTQNAIARSLLSHAELAGLGIVDAREPDVLPPDLTKKKRSRASS